MTLTECYTYVGRTVLYRAHPSATPEEGTITGVGDVLALVRYRGEESSKGTFPADLKLAFPS